MALENRAIKLLSFYRLNIVVMIVGSEVYSQVQIVALAFIGQMTPANFHSCVSISTI